MSTTPNGPNGTVRAVLAEQITAIDHVGIAVPDLDAAIAFHVEVLGLTVVHTEVNEDQGVHEAMLQAAGSHPDGEGVRPTAVQLLAPLRPDSPLGRFLDRRGPGLQQLAYRVADVDTACGALRAAGLRVLFERPRPGTAGSRVNFVHPADAGGVLVELVEPARTGAPAGHSAQV